MAKILIADIPEGSARLTKVLSARHELFFAKTYNEVHEFFRMGSEFDCVICGFHFDDSRMMDLLMDLKAKAVSQSVPFICFRQAPTTLPAYAEKSTGAVAKAIGASAYIDASEESNMSDEQLREEIDRVLNSRAIS